MGNTLKKMYLLQKSINKSKEKTYEFKKNVLPLQTKILKITYIIIYY